MDFKKILIRSLSGSIYIAIIVAACIFGGLALNLLAALFGIFGIMEIRKMRYGSLLSQKGITTYDCLGIFLLAFSNYIIPLLFWLLWLFGRCLVAIYSKKDAPEKSMAVDIATQVYLGLTVAMIPAFEIFDCLRVSGGMTLLSVFIIIWVNDTGAFLVGSLFGKHRLFERISPKKSWEGFWGGFLLSVATGALFGLTPVSLTPYPGEYNGLFWMIAGALISVTSTYGDLFESLIKRRLHTKDSGNMIPGHGGILDRIDSLLFVVPIFFLFAIIFSYLF